MEIPRLAVAVCCHLDLAVSVPCGGFLWRVEMAVKKGDVSGKLPGGLLMGEFQKNVERFLEMSVVG